MPELTPTTAFLSPAENALALPAVIEEAGGKARRRFVEFFTANIRKWEIQNLTPKARRLAETQLSCAWIEEIQQRKARVEVDSSGVLEEVEVAGDGMPGLPEPVIFISPN